MLTRVLFILLPTLYSVTLFLSAGLLFVVEPMIGKMILPLLGGTPAVWNTCMMFFQALLLAGYGYAHIISRTTINRQIFIHLVILITACVALPIGIPRQWLPSAEGSPIAYILRLLLMSVGLPFFILSSNSLLLQKWFSRSNHPSARDPYFLYSASNLGSMLALISYPTLIEPHFRLAEQSRLWAAGFLLLLLGAVFCAWLVKKYLNTSPSEGELDPNERTDGGVADDSRVTFRERLRWVLLAFVPSSLMLGVTAYLSTDVAAIPLFWVVPLALYLLSFIIVFARVPAVVHRMMIMLLPVSISTLVIVNFANMEGPKWIMFSMHLINFFIYCMVCHGAIANSRPTARHLTEFYLWISVGGVLGGVFNALIAPVAFNTLLEYPLALIFGALLLPAGRENIFGGQRKWRIVLLYVAVPAALVMLTYWSTNKWNIEDINLKVLADFFHVDQKILFQIAIYSVLGLFCYGLVFLKKPYLFGIAIATLLLTLVMTKDIYRGTVYQERSFYGILTVVKEGGDFMSLYHGTTLHGKQWLDPDKRFDPLTYYATKGPVGQVFAEFSGAKKKDYIAVAGLGTGSIAAYVWPGQEIHYYEIDPAIKRIASSPRYFSYLNDCRGQVKLILGDARLMMEKAPPHHYGIIILDAFSSDAIPVHLLTQEAVNLYFSKLKQDGVLLVHISNRYVDLAPVLASLTNAKGYAARVCKDDGGGDLDNERNVSKWVLMARRETDFGSLANNNSWKNIEGKPNVSAWTDDFSNILSIFKW